MQVNPVFIWKKLGSFKKSLYLCSDTDVIIENVKLSKIIVILGLGMVGSSYSVLHTYSLLFAGRHHIPLMEYLPDYSKYGIKAPLRRNTQIIKEASLVIAFPSADSRGTIHAISEAKKMKKTVKVVRI